MSDDLLTLYQPIRETPALSVDLPEETGTPIRRISSQMIRLGIYPGSDTH